jgi:hypothetical protein
VIISNSQNLLPLDRAEYRLCHSPAQETLPVNSRRAPADEVFVVRFWREQQNTEQDFRWRAQVRSVTGRDRHVADSVEAVFALIRARLELASAAEPCGLQDD